MPGNNLALGFSAPTGDDGARITACQIRVARIPRRMSASVRWRNRRLQPKTVPERCWRAGLGNGPAVHGISKATGGRRQSLPQKAAESVDYDNATSVS